MSKPDEETIQKMHRWFAIECNNRGWELAALESRAADQDKELLECAYAAAHHWAQIGKPINGARADMLLAHALSHIDQGEQAVRVAKRCLEFCEDNECDLWDRAFAHLEMSYAAWVAGDAAANAKHEAIALKQAQRLDDPKDREAFNQEVVRINRRKASATDR